MTNSSWQESQKELIKDLKFDNFKGALDFVNKVGEIAEKLQHHPDIKLYNYNQVQLRLFTHDADKITDKDYQLASEIDKI